MIAATYTLGQKMTSQEAMALALQTAEKGRGWVHLNPLVGCVVVDKNHCFLASGAHEKWGEAHAEINALNKIPSRASLEGGTLYVTLEPCSHRGKTPPCAVALTQTGLSKVVYGYGDPNPEVSGRGLKILRDSGLEVQHYKEFESQCALQLDEYLHFRKETGRPYITLKVASSLDGQLALANGQSQWITSSQSRVLARHQRAWSGGTLVGAQTLLNDNPKLDFRETSFENLKNNNIVIFDPKNRVIDFLQQSQVLHLHGAERIIVLTEKENRALWEAQGVQAIEWEDSQQGWHRSLESLYQAGIHSLFVEGGAGLHSEILKWELAQKLFLFLAPKIMGSGIQWTKNLNFSSMSNLPILRERQIQILDEDILITGWF